MSVDVAVVGGGIVGCALAAFLAEGGARVRLYERAEIAAGASGRNSGVVQHPLDEALIGLYDESLAHYRELGHGFELPAEAAGVLVVAGRPEALVAEHAEVAARFPELEPELLEDAAAAEPELAAGVAAYRLDTGRPVPPGAAARAFAARAREAGAELLVGEAAQVATRGGRPAGGSAGDEARIAGRAGRPVGETAGDAARLAGRVVGVMVGGELHPAGAVVVAAGPWSREAIGGWVPVAPLWGVVAELELPRPPGHVIEESGVGALTAAEGVPPSLFSIVTARGISAVGSTFLPGEPDPAALAPVLLERGTRFLPALAGARPRSVRACARPSSADGRPLLGPVPGVEGLAVAAGHGPWGITLGPASARLVADGLLGRPVEVPRALAAGRFGPAA